MENLPLFSINESIIITSMKQKKNLKINVVSCESPNRLKRIGIWKKKSKNIILKNCERAHP